MHYRNVVSLSETPTLYEFHQALRLVQDSWRRVYEHKKTLGEELTPEIQGLDDRLASLSNASDQLEREIEKKSREIAQLEPWDPEPTYYRDEQPYEDDPEYNQLVGESLQRQAEFS